MLLRRYHEKEKIEPKVKETKDAVLNDLTVKELKEEAKHKEIVGYSNLTKRELIEVLAGD